MNTYPNPLNLLSSVLARESVIILSDFWEPEGNIALDVVGADTLHGSLELAVNVAHKPELLNHFCDLQQREGSGLLNIMDRVFRVKLGLNDFDPRCSYVFGWCSQLEVHQCAEVSSDRQPGKYDFFAAIDYLISYCRFPYQFPCHFAGIPHNDKFTDLVFICDSRKPSKIKLNLEV